MEKQAAEFESWKIEMEMVAMNQVLYLPRDSISRMDF